MEKLKDKGRWKYEFTCPDTGQKVWKRYTNETSEDVITFLESKNLKYIVKGANNISIYTHNAKFSYYYTTGKGTGLFSSAFHSMKQQKYLQFKNIEAFYNELLEPTIKQEEKNLNLTVNSVNERYVYEKTTGKNFSETFYPQYRTDFYEKVDKEGCL
jgi:hypothetical protein